MHRFSIPTLFLALASLLWLADPASAQVSRIPNSGCTGAAYPTPVGTPALGQGFGITCPPCNRGEDGFVVLGTTGRGITFGPPTTCARDRCTLACDPITVLFPATAWRILIPNDRTLVGACLCIQCGCFDRAVPCITLSGALQACVTP